MYINSKHDAIRDSSKISKVPEAQISHTLFVLWVSGCTRSYAIWQRPWVSLFVSQKGSLVTVGRGRESVKLTQMFTQLGGVLELIKIYQ